MTNLEFTKGFRDGLKELWAKMYDVPIENVEVSYVTINEYTVKITERDGTKYRPIHLKWIMEPKTEG